jgi:hypothetical protein
MKFLSFLTVGALFLGALAAPIAVGETFEDLEARGTLKPCEILITL